MNQTTQVVATQDVLEVQRRKIANVFKGSPWVFPNAVRNGPNKPCLVKVVTENGGFVGWADYNPQAPVRARVLSRDEEWTGEELFLRQRLQAALERRLRLGFGFNASAIRLVNGEGDGLPGLVIDAYGTTIVYDFTSVGMLRRRELIAEILQAQFKDYRHIQRMSEESAKREGCDPLAPKETQLEFAENALAYHVPIDASQKTGFYLDQRDNRKLIARWAAGRKVLDLFCYHAAFSMNAMAGGAKSALAVDSSEAALEIATANANRNGLPLMVCHADVFKALQELETHGPFDMVICDPPKLAPRRNDRNKAMKAYRYLTRNCLRLLNPGGILLVSSCSQIIGLEDLRELLAQEGARLGVALDVIHTSQQPADHPWPVGFEQGRYLSTVVVEFRGAL